MRLAGFFLSVCTLFTTAAVAQTGDQMLDGIGETGMIARYTFKADANDWSRNNLHARINGKGFAFVQDSLFGNVLALKGDAETFVTLPGGAVSGEESLSISGWLFMKASTPGQVFVDFGKNANARLLVSPLGLRPSRDSRFRCWPAPSNTSCLHRALCQTPGTMWFLLLMYLPRH